MKSNQADSAFYDELNYQINSMNSRQNSCKMMVVGCGGAGINSVDRLLRMGIQNTKCIAIDTDMEHLVKINAHQKILIGKNITKGYGTKNNREIGEFAASEKENVIRIALGNAKIVFVTCGLGGGTGSGSLPVVARIAKNIGAIVIAFVHTPSRFENGKKLNLQRTIQELKEVTDSMLVLDNQKLIEQVPELPIIESFFLSDEPFASIIKIISEIISNHSLVSISLEDIKTIINNGDELIGGFSESTNSVNNFQDALSNALNFPLIEINFAKISGMLIFVTAGNQISLNKLTVEMNKMKKKIDTTAKFMWGLRINSTFKDKIQVGCLLSLKR